MGMNFKGVETRLDKELVTFLLKIGFFKDDKLHYYKPLSEDVIFYISFNVKGYEYDDFSVQSIFSLTFKNIERFWVVYRDILGEDHQPYPRTISFLKSYLNPELDKKYHKHLGEAREPIKTEEDIKDYMEQFKKEYEELIVPFVEKVTKIEWLDEKLNSNYIDFKLTPPFTRMGMVYRKLIVAKLNDNPMLEEMYLKFRATRENYLKANKNQDVSNSLIVLDKVYNDLKLMDLS